MSVFDRIRDLDDERMRVWHRGKEVLDAAGRSGLTAEQRANLDQAFARIDEIDRERDGLLSSDEAKREREFLNEELRHAVGPYAYDAVREDERQALSDFLRGRIPAINIDLRRAANVTNAYRDGARGDDFAYRSGIFADTGSSGGSLVIPSLVSSTIYQVMTSANVLRRMNTTVMTTPTGAPLAVPTGTAGVGTQVANQDTVIGGTDPSLAAHTLHAYVAGEIVSIANDLITDSDLNILEWVGTSIAQSIGTLEESWLVAGAGTTLPLGVMKSGATGSGGTVATGGTIIYGPAGAVGEKLLDVVYSVNNFYRQNAQWLMSDSMLSSVRKVRDGGGGTVGAFIFQPSATTGLPGGEPDRLLGYPVFSSTNVPAAASGSLVAAFGDFSRYVVREVGGLRLETSADVNFSKNQLTVRGLSRVDGVLTDTTAINYLRSATA